MRTTHGTWFVPPIVIPIVLAVGVGIIVVLGWLA